MVRPEGTNKGEAMVSDDPIATFADWYREAQESEPKDPNAMALATVAPDGMPSVRMVLLKGFDARGFVFYTNLGSRKGQQIEGQAKAAVCLHWKSLRRQVRIEGEVAPVSEGEADDYFASRPRDSQIGAWASKQSQPLEGRFVLERRIAKYAAKFGVGAVPRPEFWSGFRIQPRRIEFWREGAFRLHDRLVYHREGDGWTTERLFP